MDTMKDLELVLERVVDVPKDLIWDAWTKPELLKQWFCPLPWKTVECEMDLRPGGVFRTVMQGPSGESHDSSGCFLEIVPYEKLVWTDCLLPGFYPAQNPFMTGIITLESQPGGTKYTARALHRDLESKKKHEEMGFQQGWGMAFDQMMALLKK